MRLLLGRTACLGLLVFGLATAAEGASLCGITYGGRAELADKLRRDHAKFYTSTREKITTAWIEYKPTIWWFADRGSTAFPAIVCAANVRGDGNYFSRSAAEADCRKASHAACLALRRRIGRAKF
jgi:hypothetical protein